jgi:serine/threonine protein kinase
MVHSGRDAVEPPAADDAGSLTVGIVGTRGYMSPEQGRGGPVRPESDIYSLGATLYTLLHGQPPPHGDFEVADSEPTQGDEVGRRPLVKRLVPPALDAICARAMADRPSDRYPDPAQLADDVEHWLADEPVSVYRDGPITRATRWARGILTPDCKSCSQAKPTVTRERRSQGHYSSSPGSMHESGPKRRLSMQPGARSRSGSRWRKNRRATGSPG